MTQQSKNFFLLVDNAPSHSVQSVELKNLKVLKLPPNCTAKIQPLDAGLIAAVKLGYRRYQIERAIQRDDAGEKDVYTVDIITATKWCKQSWEGITAESVKNCWRHAGLLVGGNEQTTLPLDFDDIRALSNGIGQLNIEDALSAEEFIHIAEENNVFISLGDEEIVDFVIGGADSDDESEHEEEEVFCLTCEEKMHHLRNVIWFLEENSADEKICKESLTKLYWKLRDLSVAAKEERLVQPTLFDYFYK